MNAGGGISGGAAGSGLEYAAEIQELTRSVVSRFVSADGLAVDYGKLEGSADLKSFEAKIQRLADLDPSLFEGRGQRLSFWINLYNLLVIREVVRSGAFKAAGLEKEFFKRRICTIAGSALSLNDIEYGILRGNAPRSYLVWGQFYPGDKRRRLMLDPCEPRVCFALVKASRSGPPLRFFEAEGIEGQLYRAAVDFIRNGGVVINREENTITLSHIFKSRARDFGGSQGAMRFITRHMESPGDAAYICLHAGKDKTRFRDCDQILNRQSEK